MKKLLLVLGILFLINTALALDISVDDEIELFNDGYLELQITNTTNAIQNLSINFYSPTKISIYSPETISANETIHAKIKIYNEFEKYTEINSKLEVFLGNEYEEKNIIVKFYPPEEQNLVALFSLGILSSVNAFEIGLFFIMVMIIAILLISFIVKITRDR